MSGEPMQVSRPEDQAQSAPPPDLTAILVNWNTCQMLADCLETLFQACATARLPADTGNRPIDCEVLVVDNASSDGSADMVEERFPQVTLIRNTENAGFSRANNQAIRQSCGRYVLLLNTDAFIDGASLEKLLRLLAARPEIGAAGPNLVYPDGSPQVSHGALPTLRSEVLSLFGLDKRFPPRPGEIVPAGDGLPAYMETGTVEGASPLLRRDALEGAGLMDESFFFFSEEVDLFCRIGEAGWKVVYVPDTRVVHVRGGSTGIVPRRVLLLYRAKLHYFEKHYGLRQRDRLWRVMRLATFLKYAGYSILQALSLGRVSKASLWREIWRGLQDSPDFSIQAQGASGK